MNLRQSLYKPETIRFGSRSPNGRSGGWVLAERRGVQSRFPTRTVRRIPHHRDFSGHLSVT
mgnify:CR=1 FL=1